MIKMIIAVTQSISKLGWPDFAYLIYIDDDNYNDEDNDDDDDKDDKDGYSCNSVNFKVMTSRFCMELDLDNIK